MKSRVSSQRQQILTMLREAGSKGVTNTQLQTVGVCWHNCTRGLYDMGYKITNEHIGNGIYKYVLVKEPEKIITNRPKAGTILFDAIIGKITANKLIDILKEFNLTIARKQHYYKERSCK